MVNLGPATGEHTTGARYPEWVASRLVKQAARANVVLCGLEDVSDAPPLAAFVYRDRWVVACPCGGNLSMAWNEGPHLYMCPACWNGGDGFRRYEFPADRARGEAVLRARRLPRHRNWLPGEAVSDLVRENTAHSEGMAA